MKTKKTYKKIFLFFIPLLLFSCQEMEMDSDLGVDDKLLWDNPSYINSYIIDLISMMPNGFSPDEFGDGIFYANATDEAENSNPAALVQNFNTGNISPASEIVSQVWNKYYNGIYKVNLFLHKTGSLNFDHYAPEQRDLYLENIKKYRVEARFLRGLFYYELIKRFGGVVLTGDTYIEEVKDLSQTNFSSGRSSFSQCADYIIGECNEIIANGGLPLTDLEAQGRPNQLAVMALECKTLALKVSPYYNTSVTEGSQEQMDIWMQILIKAKTLLGKRPVTIGPYNIYNGTTTEVILGYRMQNINFLERINYPIGSEAIYTNGSTNPTQNLVDAFRMQNGMKISDPGSGYDADNPYQGRDQRLLLTVLPNGTNWFERGIVPRQIETFIGGRDGMDRIFGTRTGYYLKKYINPWLDLRQNYGDNRVWPIFRYADIMLLFAEAVNEVYGPYTAGEAGSTATSILNKVVKGSGGLPGLPGSGNTKEALRERIREESFIELAFENQRAWNLRRWGIAAEVLSSPIYRMKITKDSLGYFQYEKEILENRYFDERMMLYPIPLRAVNNGLDQNPGW